MELDSRYESYTTHATLGLLQTRLRRLEFLLTGDSTLDGLPDAAEKSANNHATVCARLDAIQRSLSRLKKGNDIVGGMIGDIETLHNKYPELRKDASSDSIQDYSMRATVVLANTTIYPETASRLESLQNLQIPTAENSSKLTALGSEIYRCRQNQDQIDDEIQSLRQRTARCLEWWVKTGVVWMGDLWEEWDHRMTELAHQVARFERQRKEQEGYI